MNIRETSLVLQIFGIIWVGGGGFLMYRYPTWFVKLNARFGVNANQKFVRAVGVAEICLAAIAAISVPVMVALGLY